MWGRKDQISANSKSDSRDQAALSPTADSTSEALLIALIYWCYELKFLIALRLLNKHWRDYVAKQTSGPYPDKAAFIMANTGIYHTKASAMEAIRIYQNTIHSTSTLPAVFYALSERLLLQSTLFKEGNFTQGENIYQMGRVYGPIIHNWPINAAWVLAQLHKGRHILVMTSYPVGDNTHRPGGDYSALTKEIATTFKAGYGIKDVEFRQGGRRIIYLGPTAYLDRSTVWSLSVRNLILADEDCQFAISNMRDTVNTITRVSPLAVEQAMNELRVLLEDIRMAENDIEKFSTVYSSGESRLKTLLSLLITNEAKKQFMKLFDTQRSNWDLFNPEEFDQIKLRLSIAIRNAIIDLAKKYMAMLDSKYTIDKNIIMIKNKQDTYLNSKYPSISLFSKRKTESIRPMEVNTKNTIIASKLLPW